MKLLSILDTYPVRHVKEAAVEAICRHLWYFSEHLVTLSLFDERVNDETKEAMIANFTRSPNPTFVRRLDKKTFSLHTPLEEYVTCRSLKLFDLLCNNGQQKANSFLLKPPTDLSH